MELLSRVDGARRRLQILEEGLIPQARSTLEAGSASYANGRTVFISLLDDALDLLEFERDLERQRAALAPRWRGSRRAPAWSSCSRGGSHDDAAHARAGRAARCGLVAAALAWNVLGPAGKAAGQPAQKWTCAMHPQIIRDHPGSCPICGMDLVPVGSRLTAAGSGVAGQGVVHLDAARRQLIGVRTARVELSPFRRTIRAVGRVSYDETRLRHVHTKIDGYVERLLANATGGDRPAGQPLLEIYSPELLASQQEFLVALEARDRMGSSTLSSVAGYGEDLVESARRRLQLFDMTDAQIARLEQTRTPQRTVTVYAHESGVVTMRNVTEGERIEAARPCSTWPISPGSGCWLRSTSTSCPSSTRDSPPTMHLSYLPDRAFRGTVSLIYPGIEIATRTAQVRVEFDNLDLALKPDMYAGDRAAAPTWDLASPSPRRRFLETGTRSLAFVGEEPGVFEPREIRIGARLADRYEVLSGLTPGESVVVSANFLIDSESKLKAALEAMQPGTAPRGPARRAREVMR
jgi:multidrug efflux pump subunit AcrA (membrane-fusion protein)